MLKMDCAYLVVLQENMLILQHYRVKIVLLHVFFVFTIQHTAFLVNQVFTFTTINVYHNAQKECMEMEQGVNLVFFHVIHAKMKLFVYPAK